MDLKFNPELHLEQEEISALASVAGQPGFKVALKIFRAGVDWFVGQVINANSADHDEVVSKQIAAKVAAQMFTLFANRVNEEVITYVHSVPSDKPIVSAEGLDLENEIVVNEESLF